MRLPSLKKVFISSTVTAPELGRLFAQLTDYLRESLEPLLANPRAVSTTQSVTLVAATAKVISHSLSIPRDKTPNGWSITDIDAAATVRRSAWDDKTITLIASANCNVQLEVW